MNTVARNTVARNTVARNTVARNTVARNTVARSTVARSTVARSMVVWSTVGAVAAVVAVVVAAAATAATADTRTAAMRKDGNRVTRSPESLQGPRRVYAAIAPLDDRPSRAFRNSASLAAAPARRSAAGPASRRAGCSPSRMPGRGAEGRRRRRHRARAVWSRGTPPVTCSRSAFAVSRGLSCFKSPSASSHRRRQVDRTYLGRNGNPGRP